MLPWQISAAWIGAAHMHSASSREVDSSLWQAVTETLHVAVMESSPLSVFTLRIIESVYTLSIT